MCAVICTATIAPVGALAQGEPDTLMVWLKQPNASLEAQAARAVSDPSSAQYGHYWTPGAIAAHFEPSVSAATTVASFLRHEGYSNVTIAPDRLYVTGVADSLAVFAMFGASIPSQIAKVADGAIDDDAEVGYIGSVAPRRAHPHPFGVATPLYKLGPRIPGVSSAHPSDAAMQLRCSSYYGQYVATTLPAFRDLHPPNAICGYQPSQLKTAYGLQSFSAQRALATQGAGETIAVVDAYDWPHAVADANKMARMVDVPSLRPDQFRTDVPQGTLANDDWAVEQELDVQWAHAVAPAANIVYVGGRDASMVAMIEADTRAITSPVDGANIITNSWSFGPDGPNQAPWSRTIREVIHAWNAMSMEAALLGKSVLYASGDNGSWEYGSTPRAEYPASDAWVTAVGGTSELIGSDGKLVARTGWSDATYPYNRSAKRWRVQSYGGGAAGGGLSKFIAQPWYQHGIVPQAIAAAWPDHVARRATSDIAGPADEYLGAEIYLPPITGIDAGFYEIGGTSLAAPFVAGELALWNQARQSVRRPAIGFANPLLYRSATLLSDVRNVTGNAQVDGTSKDFEADVIDDQTANSVHATRGWDQKRAWA